MKKNLHNDDITVILWHIIVKCQPNCSIESSQGQTYTNMYINAKANPHTENTLNQFKTNREKRVGCTHFFCAYVEIEEKHINDFIDLFNIISEFVNNVQLYGVHIKYTIMKII